MSRLVEFPLRAGASVLVPGRPCSTRRATHRRRGGRTIIEQAGHTFEAAITQVQPAAQAMTSWLRALVEAPGEVGAGVGGEAQCRGGSIHHHGECQRQLQAHACLAAPPLAERADEEALVARELTYLDFDVLLERAGETTYRARVLNAPAGQTPPARFTVPFSPLELENFLLRIGRPRRVVRRLDAPETAAIKTFGAKLYGALFQGALEVNLLRSQSEAAAKQAGLRIRLRLSDAPELGGLPWEFLYDPTRNRFLCLSDRTPLVRYLEVPDPPRPLTVSPPLQVLVMISSPGDYAQLDVEHEWARVHDALAPLRQAGRVRLERLEAATLATLRQRLRRDDWHVFHYIGHGGFDPHAQDGVLVLQDQTGRAQLVSGQDLGVLLHDHDPLAGGPQRL